MSQRNKIFKPGWVTNLLSSIAAGCVLGYIVYFLTRDHNLAITTAVICYTIVKAH